MAQATLDDDDLFSEAASEMRADVERSLAQAHEELPAPEEVWDVEAENVLGVLNGLSSTLDAGDAAAHLRDAKKWYTVGREADAFEDADDLEAEIETLETLITDIEETGETAGSLASTVPGIKTALEDEESTG